MTKDELRMSLSAGKAMDTLFRYTNGQGCLIYKAETFSAEEEIIYIPDIGLNEIPMDRPVKVAEIEDIVSSCCYTGQDFVDECGGDSALAERLFHYCDWQHPSSALPEIVGDEEDSEETSEKVRITIFQAPHASLLERGVYLKMHDLTTPYMGPVPAEYYLPVFKGDIDCPNPLPEALEARDHTILERAFFIFNNVHPDGYYGRSLSVGDVVQLEDRHYLCVPLGFTKVTFESGKKEAIIPWASVHELTTPTGLKLRASVHPESEYPCVNIDLIGADGESTRLCFVEHNPEKAPGQELCIGAYCSSDEDTAYYNSYFTEDNLYN